MGRIIKKLNMMKYNFLLLLTFFFNSMPLSLKSQNPNNELGFCFNSMSPSPLDQYTGRKAASGLLVKDFNNDVFKDIICLSINSANPNLSVITSLRNKISTGYNNGFVKDSTFVCGGINASVKNAITAGDFDTDGKLDIALVDNNKIYTLKNTSVTGSTISFACLASTNHSISSFFNSDNYIDTKDFNNDGFLDIIAMGSNVSTFSNAGVYIELYKGNGLGNFVNWGSQLITYTGLNPIDNHYDYQILDYDGDGILDIVMNNTSLNNKLLFLKGTSIITPSFAISPITLSFPLGNNFVNGFKITDINNDSKLDIVANLFDGTYYQVYSSINNNPINTAPSFTNSFLATNYAFANHFIVNDFNADNQKELIGNVGQGVKLVKGEIANPSAFNTSTNTINWLLNYNGFLQLVSEDVDNNGLPDIITNNERNLQEYVNVILNFSYNNILTPSNLNLSICSGNSINANAALTISTQGLGSFTQSWYKPPIAASQTTSPNFLITNPGNYFAVGQGDLPFSGYYCKYFTPSYTVSNGITPTISTIAASTNSCIGQNVNITLNGASQYSVTVNTNTTIPLASNIFSFTPTFSFNTLVFSGTSNGCIGSYTSTFTANPSPTITVNSSTNNICSNQTVTLTASFTGTTVPFSNWIWNGVSSATATSVFTTAPTTNINISAQAIDNKGCTSNIVNTPLSVFPNPTVQLTSGQTSICSNTTVIYSFSGASSYSYNPANGSGNNYTYTPGSSASFTVTGRDINGCVDIKNYNLTINPSATVSIVPSSSSNTICPNVTIDLVAVGTYSTLNWVHSNSSSVTETVAPTTSTTYTLDASIVAGCTTRQTITIDLFPNNTELITTSANTICPGDVVNLSINGNYYFYEWFPGNTLTQSISVSPNTSTTYTLKVIDNNTCQFRKTILIEVDQGCSVSVGNAVTANNDSNNDQLYIANIERYANNTVSVFNRYGIEVFKTDSYDNKTNNWPKPDQVNKLTAGTYFYVVDLKNGSVLKGWVEVMK